MYAALSFHYKSIVSKSTTSAFIYIPPILQRPGYPIITTPFHRHSIQMIKNHDTATNNSISDNNNRLETKDIPSPKISLSHCNTICMVPPPEHSSKAWEALTKARIQLRDPGLYRWPPHANIVYPFIDFDKNKTDIALPLEEGQNDIHSIWNETISLLQNVAAKMEPFEVTLDSLGCFGGKKRGVLWVYPKSFNKCIDNDNDDDDDDDDNDNDNANDEPLIQLQSYLQEAFPESKGKTKKGGPYIPHMTLSHFTCLEDALIAKESIEQWWDKSISFHVDKIYALKRVGDNGQFKIQATIPLGKKYGTATNIIIVHDPPIKFPDMPDVEEDWVREERMKLKQRRNRKGRGGRKSQNKNDSDDCKTSNLSQNYDIRGKSRSTDTPEEIAAKRAARKAKRERLEREKILSDIENAMD